MASCNNCQGCGTVSCPSCAGSGTFFADAISDSAESACRRCNGSGEINCPTCSGTGVFAEAQVTLKGLVKCVCNACGKPTNHDILFNHDTKSSDPTCYEEYQVLQCRGCEAVSFRHTHRSPDHGFPSNEGIFPAKEALYPSRHLVRTLVDIHWLPPNIRRAYREVHIALRNCLRTLTAIGIRATIEAVCNHKGATRRNLYDKVEELHKANLITEDQKKALHAHRLLGN
jgi:hypothetical protein